MLGTSRPNPYVGEPNGAGVMGPRGCEPLVWQNPFRIARAQGQWAQPRFKGFNASAVPFLIAKANPNRGWLALAALVTGNGAVPFVIAFSPLQAPLKGSPPGFAKGGVFGPNDTGSFWDIESYQNAGGLVTSEWWAVCWPAFTSGAFYFHEQEFYG